MFNDDVLAKCPQCGSSDTTVSSKEITCSACGFGEPLSIDDQASLGMQRDVVSALKMARMRDVLQRWGFAG